MCACTCVCVRVPESNYSTRFIGESPGQGKAPELGPRATQAPRKRVVYRAWSGFPYIPTGHFSFTNADDTQQILWFSTLRYRGGRCGGFFEGPIGKGQKGPRSDCPFHGSKSSPSPKRTHMNLRCDGRKMILGVENNKALQWPSRPPSLQAPSAMERGGAAEMAAKTCEGQRNVRPACSMPPGQFVRAIERWGSPLAWGCGWPCSLSRCGVHQVMALQQCWRARADTCARQAGLLKCEVRGAG